jgi:hypothetical protein
MHMMVGAPGLVPALVEVACRHLHHGDPLEHIVEVMRSRSIAARAILNLSWAPENKAVLAEDDSLIDLLIELCVHRSGAPLNCNRTIREIIVGTRRHVFGAIRNLTAAPRHAKMRLAGYKNGVLLDVISHAALNDPDDEIKNRCFAAIHNFATHDIADRIANHSALVLALHNAIVTRDQSEHAQAVKMHASATLMVLERSITPEMEAYSNLRQLIASINATRLRQGRTRDELINGTELKDVVEV